MNLLALIPLGPEPGEGLPWELLSGKCHDRMKMSWSPKAQHTWASSASSALISDLCLSFSSVKNVWLK